MELTSIYKENKLYKISQPFQENEKEEMTVPEGFGGVAILYEYEEGSKLPEDMSTFLGKVIEGGMKLEPAKVLTANMCYTNVSLQKLSELARAKVVVIFGVTWLNELKNANILKNEIVKLYGMRVLITDTLDVINTNDAAKKAFWLQLKKIFK